MADGDGINLVKGEIIENVEDFVFLKVKNTRTGIILVCFLQLMVTDDKIRRMQRFVRGRAVQRGHIACLLSQVDPLGYTL